MDLVTAGLVPWPDFRRFFLGLAVYWVCCSGFTGLPLGDLGWVAVGEPRSSRHNGHIGYMEFRVKELELSYHNGSMRIYIYIYSK